MTIRFVLIAIGLINVVGAPPVHAFIQLGHNAIERRAYEQMSANKTQRVVLCNLMAAGLLAAPEDFSREKCESQKTIPIADSGDVDAVLPLQTGDAGQCYHFMAARIDDQINTEPSKGGMVPFQLEYAALPRCLRLLDRLAKDATDMTSDSQSRRRAAQRLIHAVTDSYSDAHVARIPANGAKSATAVEWETSRIEYLKVWRLIAWYSGSSDLATHHAVEDPRDYDFLDKPDAAKADGCFPAQDTGFLVGADCLSRRAAGAVFAVVSLLSSLDASIQPTATPLDNNWDVFKAAHFAPAHVYTIAELRGYVGAHGKWCFLSDDVRQCTCCETAGDFRDPSCFRDFELSTLVSHTTYLNGEIGVRDRLPGVSGHGLSFAVGIQHTFEGLGESMSLVLGSPANFLPYINVLAGVDKAPTGSSASSLGFAEIQIAPFTVSPHPAVTIALLPLDVRLFPDGPMNVSPGLTFARISFRPEGVSYHLAPLSAWQIGATVGDFRFRKQEGTKLVSFGASIFLGIALDANR